MAAELEDVAECVEIELDTGDVVACLATVEVCTIEPSATVECETLSIVPIDLKVQS
jgi:hypothetical protein